MKNTAEITNDGASVYMDSAVKPDKTVRLTLFVANLLAIATYGVIIYSTWSIDSVLMYAIYALLPVLYAGSLGRLTLWNLYGRENIIISTRSIAYRRSYGIFTTRLKVLTYKTLRYAITEKPKSLGEPQGTIQFADQNEQGHSIGFFSSAISLPVKQLEHFAKQVRFLFTLERMFDPEYDLIHLN